MMAGMKFRAVVQLHNQGVDHNDLKRLALFFDEIYFILPTIFTFTHEFLVRREQARISNNDISQDSDNFDFLRDTEVGMITTDIGLQPQLAETLSVLKENGIAKEVNDVLRLTLDDHLLAIRNHLASFDIHDKTFNELSETSSEDYNLAKLSRLRMSAQREDMLDSPPMPLFVIIQNAPEAILNSYEITATLYASHETSSSPVFLHPKLKRIMEYRYAQYKKGLEFLKKSSHDIISPADFKANFGEITFNIANSLLSSELIAMKTPEQIVKYRNVMTEARQHFLSENLIEIASLVQDNPWNSQTKKEIEKYIMGKLNQAILQYNEASRETWEKLFGNIAVHIGQIAKTAAIGSGAGGVIGNLIPNTSTWHMLLLGALAGAATEAPNLVKSITETILDDRKGKRSSIAYIARFR